MAFIINEDEALKRLLSGLTVSDQNDTERPVKVWFRLPEAEERQVTYPFITIDLIDVTEERDRAQRGRIYTGYEPEGYDPNPIDSDYKTETPIPVSLVYQITTHARSAWHDRQLMSQMYGDRLPLRFGSLEVPADNTVRRLDLQEMRQVDGLDANDKRVFRKAYTVAVSAELFPDGILAVQRVSKVSPTVFHQLEPFIIETSDVA